MVLQNFIYPKPGVCTEEALYFRRFGDVRYTWTKGCIFVDRGGAIEFDTYFNSFSAEKWYKYTGVDNVSVQLTLRGAFRVTLMRKEKTSSGIFVDVVGEHDVSTGGRIKKMIIPFESRSWTGIFCVKLVSLKDNSAFFNGKYCADIPENAVRNVKIGVNICTFRRESFVKKNLQSVSDAYFTRPNSLLYDKLELFISDNGKTLSDNLLINDKIHIFQNKNVGGAGGFTRGLIEITKKQQGFTHVLLMDDDIVLEPEVIYRTYAVLALLKDAYADAFIGGAMLRLDQQNIQVESGAVWNGGNLYSLKGNLNLNDLDACLFNEFEEYAQYNAWWYCVIPTEIIRDDNLPLPLFIRGDDVEYGLRNTKHLVLMNGICVWHEPFENKYSSVMYYYILRNQLIDNSVHSCPFSKKDLAKQLRGRVFREIVYLRYQNAHLLLKGVEDFYKGVDWLKQQDGEKLHQEILKEGHKMQYVEELPIPFAYGQYAQTLDMQQKWGLKRLLRLLTFNGLLFFAKKTAIVPTVDPRPIQFYRVKTALHYDSSSKKGFVTHKSLREMVRVLKRYLALCLKTSREYDKTVESYRKRMSEMTQIGFWKDYLELENNIELVNRLVNETQQMRGDGPKSGVTRLTSLKLQIKKPQSEKKIKIV